MLIKNAISRGSIAYYQVSHFFSEFLSQYEIQVGITQQEENELDFTQFLKENTKNLLWELSISLFCCPCNYSPQRTQYYSLTASK